MNCILAGISNFTLKLTTFGVPMRFWTLWLFELLYVCLDRLILTLPSIWVRPWEKAPKIMSSRFCQHGMNALARHVHWCGYFGIAWISHPGLLLEVLPCNVGVISMVCLLPSHYSKGIISLGAFGCLEMAAIMPVWFFLWLLECVFTSCLGSGPVL